jgi:hypothetical protein
MLKRSPCGYSAADLERRHRVVNDLHPQPQSLQIRHVPADIVKHSLQRSDGKRLAQGMIGDDDPSSVTVPVDVVAAADAHDAESVCPRGLNQAASSNPSRGLSHFQIGLDIHRHSRRGPFECPLFGVVRDGFSRRPQVIHVKLDCLADVGQRLVVGSPPSVTAFECGTESVERRFTVFQSIRLNHHLKNMRFHAAFSVS